MSARLRTSIIGKLKKNATKTDRNQKQGNLLTWERAELFVALQGTFAQGKGEHAAFLATAATAARCDESSVTEGVKAIEVRDGLSKANRDKVVAAGWSVSAVKDGLSGADTRQAARIIALAEKYNGGKGTTNTKVIRDLKKKVIVPTPRATENRLAKLIESLKEDYDRLLASYGPEGMLAVIAGAQLAQDNQGKQVAQALTMLANTAAPAATVVAS